MGGLEGVKHKDDIFVAQPAQNFNLLTQVGEVLLCFVALSDELQSYDLTTVLATSFEDFAEGAFANGM
jgi:hypothetical protein